MRKLNKVWKTTLSIVIVAGVTTFAIYPFLRSEALSDKIRLVVDLHGYMPSTSRTPTADEPLVFNSTHYIAEAFMDENPDIEIVWARTKPVGGLDSEVAQWFTTQIAGKTIPAITFSWGTRYEDRGWYLEIDEFLDEPNSWPYEGGYVTWRDVFRDYIWETGVVDNSFKKTVAIPITVYPGASTGYFYNKRAFQMAGIGSVPTTWQEFIIATQKLEEKGYVGVAPWLYFNTTTTFDAWVFQSIMSPSYVKPLVPFLDYDGDGMVNKIETARGVLEGLFSPNGDNAYLARDLYQNLKYYYAEMLDKGWASIDYNAQWLNGEVGIREEGLWALPIENSNVVRTFDFGVFVAPLVSNDTSAYLDEIEYSMGPYQPAPDLSLNIMKEAVKDNPEMLDAAVRFLKFLSKPDNVSLICVENGGVLGAVKNTRHSQLIDGFIRNKFPIGPKAGWASGFTDEHTDQLNRSFENWVNGNLTDEAFYNEVDTIQNAGARRFLSNMGVDYLGWVKG
ncbi:MAG: ABC transporter substrate-binding protein [Bacilli bacterium]|jgi:raffinose/stachyose/melibiose transport system substrate-binding protein